MQKSKIPVFVFLSMGLWFGQLLHAQPMNLDKYLQQAKDNSPELKDHQNQVQISGIEEQKIKARYNRPQLDVSADVMKAPIYKGIGYDEVITNGALYSAQLNAKMQVFTSAYSSTETDVQKTLQGNLEHQSRLTWHQLQQQVMDQYIQCFALQQQFAVVQKQLGLIQEQIEVMKKLAGSGIVKVSDVKLLEIEYLAQQGTLEGIRNQQKLAISELNLSCGITDTSVIQLQTPDIKLKQEQVGMEQSEFQKQFYFDSLSVVNDQRLLDLNYKPHLYVYGNTGLNSSQITGMEKKFGFSGGLSFTLPLYDGNQRKLSNQQAVIQQATIENYRQVTESRLHQQQMALQDQIRAIEVQQGTVDKQIEAYQSLMGLYKEELKSGLVSSSDYLVLWRNYLDAQTSKIDLEKQRLILITNYNYVNW